MGPGAEAPHGGRAGPGLEPHGAELGLRPPGGRGLELAAHQVLVQGSELGRT